MSSTENLLPRRTVVYAVLTGLLLLTLVLYQQTIAYLNSIWSEISVGEYAHGYLVVLISAYLIYSNRKVLRDITPCPVYSVLPLLFLSVLLWLSAVLTSIEVVQAVALLFVIFTLVWSLLGHRMIRSLAFPILFLAYAIPVWFPLSPLLQEITADVVFWLARMIDMPAFREGSQIILPSGVFSIEEACSGLRFLLAALTLGSLYAYMNYVSLWARIIVVLVAAATAVLTNFLRVFIVVYLGYSTEMQHPWVDDHLMLGWYLFGGLVAIMLFLDARLYKHQPIAVEDAVSGPGDSDNCDCNGRNRYILVPVLCVFILSLGPVAIHLQNEQQPDMRIINISLPGTAQGWSQPLPDSDNWQPLYSNAIQQKYVQTVRDEMSSIYIAYYPVQTQGAEVINDLNRINNKKVWRTAYGRPLTKYIDGQPVLEQLIKNGDNTRQLVWYWYNIGGQVTTNKYEAKALQLKGMLKGQPQAYMVAIAVVIKGDIKQTRKALRGINRDLQKPLADMTVTR